MTQQMLRSAAEMLNFQPSHSIYTAQVVLAFSHIVEGPKCET